jgi:DNA polymerase bacteriophage-type
VSRPAVEEALTNGGLPCAEVEEMLRIRLRTARASVKKLDKMLTMVSSGDRLKGQFQFLGASRTGRWAGRGCQPQNLPRIPPWFAPLEFVKMATAATASLDAVAPAPVLDCVSWTLRACLGAGANAGLWGFDFSQIEARTLAWLSGQVDVLEVFRSGEDIYTWAAKQFGSQNRQLGKVLILALGFGMGAEKLRKTAWQDYALKLSLEEAEKFKTMWRRQNPMIVAFWREIEAAAKGAVMRRGRTFPVLPSTITLIASAKTLQMRLPSGRVLFYHKPYIATDGSLRYWGEWQGKWVERKTWGGTLAENATQAVARDVMSEAMLRIAEQTGTVPLLCVHDEIVYAASHHTEALEKLVRQAPSWATDLPIAGETKRMTRYGVVARK